MIAWLLPEYCPGPFYMGWHLYVRQHDDARSDPNPYSCGWLFKRFGAYRAAWRALREAGWILPDPDYDRDFHDFEAAFVRVFPAGLLVEVDDRENVVRVCPEPPDTGRRARLLLFNARMVVEGASRMNRWLESTCPCRRHTERRREVTERCGARSFQEPEGGWGWSQELLLESVQEAERLRERARARALRRGEEPAPSLPEDLRGLWVAVAERRPADVPEAVVLALSGRGPLPKERCAAGDLCSWALDRVARGPLSQEALAREVAFGDPEAPYDLELAAATVRGLVRWRLLAESPAGLELPPPRCGATSRWRTMTPRS